MADIHKEKSRGDGCLHSGIFISAAILYHAHTPEARGQKPEVRRQTSGARGQWPEASGRMSEAGGQRAELIREMTCACGLHAFRPEVLVTCDARFAAGNLLSSLVYGGIDAGNLLIGFFIRYRIGRGDGIASARQPALFGSCVLLSSAVIVGIVDNRFVALAALVITGFGLGAFLVIYLSRCQELNPAHLGAVTGVLGGLGNLVYGFLSPSIGALADRGNSAVTFMVMGLLPWFAFAAMSWRPRSRH
jgi:hypothetical protein